VANTVLEFGDFRLDCTRFELYRAGRSLKVERKPLELLMLLAGSNGRLVTRVEIIEHLWGSEVFVDTEHGINTAIRKIRLVLRDDPEKPRFVQTVTGKGYRFIGAVVETRPFAEVQPAPSDGASGAPLSEDNHSNLRGGNQIPVLPTPDHQGVKNERQQSNSDSGQGRGLRRRSRLWIAVLGGLAIVILVFLGAVLFTPRWANLFLHRTVNPRIESLAVIPLDNLSGDPGQDYFADGMTDELITMLAKNSTLRITSRTSVMQYKGVHRPLRDIAKELGVDGIIEGSVVRSGDKVHLTLQMIHAASDTHIWAESYSRDGANSVSLPSEAARTVAARLNKVAVPTTAQRYASPEAHDAYLRGRYYQSSGVYDKAIESFKRATELQPDYALAWNELAFSYGASGQQSRPAETTPKAKAAIQRALELDDSLAEVHNNLAGMSCFYDWDWDRALKESARAIELDPNYAFGHFIRARILLTQNRMDESLEEVKRANELDPTFDPGALGWNLMLMRRYDAALDAARLVTEIQPENGGVHEFSADIYHAQGKDHEAAKELVKALVLYGDKNRAAATLLASDRDGYKEIVRLRLKEYIRKANGEYVTPIAFSEIYAKLGQREEALRFLEAAYKDRSAGMVYLQLYPWYDFLHSDERYRAIVRKMGLPPTY
jgi:TolB-like protein/DNA-binding winged helix-turn-helix (wHTH) protein/lipopolysaccharide biosynthesis regulator YciM